MRGKTFRTGTAALKAQQHDREQFKREVLIPAEHESAQRLLRDVVRDSPVDRGEYKAGWTVRTVENGHPHVINDAPHAGIIELGARPHWTPLSPLLEWAKRKAKDIGIEPGDVYRFAKAVQAKIAREGQAPKFIMRNRMNDAVRYMDQAVRRRTAQFRGRSSEVR